MNMFSIRNMYGSGSSSNPDFVELLLTLSIPFMEELSIFLQLPTTILESPINGNSSSVPLRDTRVF